MRRNTSKWTSGDNRHCPETKREGGGGELPSEMVRQITAVTSEKKSVIEKYLLASLRRKKCADLMEMVVGGQGPSDITGLGVIVWLYLGMKV